MSLKDELLKMRQEILQSQHRRVEDVLLLHAKAHMFHNKKMHAKALELMEQQGLKHKKYDVLDE